MWCSCHTVLCHVQLLTCLPDGRYNTNLHITGPFHSKDAKCVAELRPSALVDGLLCMVFLVTVMFAAGLERALSRQQHPQLAKQLASVLQAETHLLS